MLTYILIWCVVSLAIAGFVQGISGFGFGIISMALLPFAVSLKDAAPLVVLFTLPSTATVFRATWRHFEWRSGLLLIAGYSVGVPSGVYLLFLLPEALLMRLLGLFLLLFALQELVAVRYPRVKLRIPAWLALPVSIFGGALDGSLSTGGPPLVAYAYSRPWTKEQIIAVLQAIFLIGAGIRLVLFVQKGLFTPLVIQIALWSMFPVLIGTMVGILVLRRISLEKLRFYVFILIGCSGLKFLLMA